ncbi:MAG: aminopeptidase P family protein [Lentisphaerae bacterium]|nr:aminopeptidase P family protein [Lentisphaerota bacterium]MBT5609371.1 aminopeptidase P family protein [Lentisphaerota bacterium]MBT7060783.1 aminopeptidase P family protein [Lentisphaerota bacterium]MBT7843502.1 aminopeptidase P family protein [Lentisphaerota bacterium]
MADRVSIPRTEYPERVARAGKLIAAAGLDVMVANSNEADYANVRYLSAFWPLFEMGGVAVSPDGQAALMIGPESENFAREQGTIPNLHPMTAYRETADPEYPGVPVSSYAKAFESIGVTNPKRIGVAGYLCTNMAMYEDLKSSFPGAEIVKADDIMTTLRSVKSPAELACLREGLRIGELAMEAMIQAVRPGMTELELAGVASNIIYANGGECEAHTIYSFGGIKTSSAIARGSHREFVKGDIVQINVGGKIDGYSPSVGRPICLGKMTDEQRRLIEYGRKMHYKTYELAQAGTVACEVVEKYEELVKEDGNMKYYLYGPCHGLGLIEVEKPWMESISKYELLPNMTFQCDTFFYSDTFGLRWENGLRVSESGPAEMMNDGSYMDIIEVDC